MSMSGIEVAQEVETLFSDMKLRSAHKYATFKIQDKKLIVVDQTSEPAITTTKEDDRVHFDKLRTLLGNEPRYCLYDFGFTISNNRKLKKMAFIFWCPENSKIGDKMVYASTKDTIKKKFAGLGLEFQANDMGDMNYNEFAADVEKKA